MNFPKWWYEERERMYKNYERYHWILPKRTSEEGIPQVETEEKTKADPRANNRKKKQ